MLTTTRLTLRRFTAADLDDLVALDDDPEVTHFVTNGAPVDRADEARTLQSFISGAGRDHETGFWAADGRPSGQFVGWFHLIREPDDPATVELGYRLRRDAWNQGLATEGARALIDRLFLTTDVQRVRAETMAVHVASRRVMVKAGLQFHRTFHADWPVRIPGDEHGDVEYLLTRTRWASDRSDDTRVPRP